MKLENWSGQCNPNSFTSRQNSGSRRKSSKTGSTRAKLAFSSRQAIACKLPVTVQLIERRIYLVRGKLDSDLAELYGVETRAFNQAVKRNPDRFPGDFMFQLTKEEDQSLRSQFVTLKPAGRHRKYLTYVFTEQGIAMLSVC
jgi:hypothetical protein